MKIFNMIFLALFFVMCTPQTLDYNFEVSKEYSFGEGIRITYRQILTADYSYCFVSHIGGEQESEFLCSVRIEYIDMVWWWVIDYEGTKYDNKCMYRCITWGYVENKTNDKRGDMRNHFNVTSEKRLTHDGVAPLTSYHNSYCFISTISGRYENEDVCSVRIDRNETSWEVYTKNMRGSDVGFSCGATCIIWNHLKENRNQGYIITGEYITPNQTNGYVYYKLFYREGREEYDNSYCFNTYRNGYMISSSDYSSKYRTYLTGAAGSEMWTLGWTSTTYSGPLIVGIRCVKWKY